MALPAGDSRQFQYELVGERGAELPHHLHDGVQVMKNSSPRLRPRACDMKYTRRLRVEHVWKTATVIHVFVMDVQMIPLITSSPTSDRDHISAVFASLSLASSEIWNRLLRFSS